MQRNRFDWEFPLAEMFNSLAIFVLELMQLFRQFLFKDFCGLLNQINTPSSMLPASLTTGLTQFSSDSAPKWHDEQNCQQCNIGLVRQRTKRNCRSCGQVFCKKCSAKTLTFPELFIQEQVCVCIGMKDNCFRCSCRYVSVNNENSFIRSRLFCATLVI